MTKKKTKSRRTPPKKNSKKSKRGNKLDRILNVEEKLLTAEKRIENKEGQLASEESAIEKKENTIEKEEKVTEEIRSDLKKESSDLEKIQQLETDIKTEVGEHPLARVTTKDIAKGLIGAFIGLAIHYTFVYGVEISQNLTMTRATLLFPITFVVGLLFIYATGFRKVTDTKLLMFMPVRLFVLYICSLIMSIVVLYMFYPSFGSSFEASYKMVAGVMLAAIVGACTADLLGKE